MKAIAGGKQKIYLIAAIVGVVVLGGIIISGETIGMNVFGMNNLGGATMNQDAITESETTEGEQTSTPETVEPTQPITHTIEMSSSGFTPSTLTIKKGDTVTFVNTDGGSYWPASAIHPTHEVYPGSSINKCGTSEEPMIFDACGSVEDSWSFTFNDAGEWMYHDHLGTSRFGKITVQ